jgi:signal transduction histidine kinase
MEEGNFEFHFKNIDLYEVVKDSVEENIPSAKKQSIDLILKEGSKAIVSADSGKLMEVVDNILSNAIKYSKPGSKIIVSLEEREGIVRVAVEDFGEGISLKTQAIMFSRFARGDILNRKEGAGIGLCISKKIIEAHKGVFSFSSQEGTGTVFYFELKTVEGEEDGPEKP